MRHQRFITTVLALMFLTVPAMFSSAVLADPISSGDGQMYVVQQGDWLTRPIIPTLYSDVLKPGDLKSALWIADIFDTLNINITHRDKIRAYDTIMAPSFAALKKYKHLAPADVVINLFATYDIASMELVDAEFVRKRIEDFEGTYWYKNRAAWARIFGVGNGTYVCGDTVMPFSWFMSCNTDGNTGMTISISMDEGDLTAVRKVPGTRNGFWGASRDNKFTYVGFGNDWIDRCDWNDETESWDIPPVLNEIVGTLNNFPFVQYMTVVAYELE
ncbi:MAG: hypothetical protein ABIJ92_04380 [Candidatus Aenigmatarchaeota archaeon]